MEWPDAARPKATREAARREAPVRSGGKCSVEKHKRGPLPANARDGQRPRHVYRPTYIGMLHTNMGVCAGVRADRRRALGDQPDDTLGDRVEIVIVRGACRVMEAGPRAKFKKSV